MQRHYDFTHILQLLSREAAALGKQEQDTLVNDNTELPMCVFHEVHLIRIKNLSQKLTAKP